MAAAAHDGHRDDVMVNKSFEVASNAETRQLDVVIVPTNNPVNPVHVAEIPKNAQTAPGTPGTVTGVQRQNADSISTDNLKHMTLSRPLRPRTARPARNKPHAESARLGGVWLRARGFFQSPHHARRCSNARHPTRDRTGSIQLDR